MTAMNYWIAPCNLEKFRLMNALQTNHGLVDWRVSCKMAVGDVVFLYISEPYHRIWYRMEVVAVDLDEKVRFNQEKYWIDKQDYYKGLNRNLTRFKVVHEYNDTTLTYWFMRDFGLGGPIQGTRRCPEQLVDCLMKKQ